MGSVHYDDQDFLPALTSQFAETLEMGDFQFHTDLPLVGSSSKYGDPIWVYYDSSKPIHKLRSKCTYSIDWSVYADVKNTLYHKQDYRAILPQMIVSDLMRFAFLFGAGVAYNDIEYQTTLRKQRQIKVRTFIHNVKEVCSKIAWIVKHNTEKGRCIHSLSDISLEMLKNGLNECPHNLQSVKGGLLALVSPSIAKYLQSPLSVTIADIQFMNWENIKSENQKRRNNLGRTQVSQGLAYSDKDGYIPLHPLMYMWLSNKSRAIVRDFLEAFGLPGEDMEPNPEYDKIVAQHKALKYSLPSIKDMVLFLFNQTENKSTRSHRHKHKFGLSCKITLDALNNARRAAEIILLLYTGMRYSHAALLKIGCIKKHNGYTFIWGTDVKGRSHDTLTETDTWITIACIRDAVTILEYIAGLASKEFLFSYENTKRGPISVTTLCNDIYDFFWINDTARRFVTSRIVDNTHRVIYEWAEHIPPHPMRFRESLALELARVGCGIPFISLQLHHMYSVYSSSVSDTTFGYGSQQEVRSGLIKGAVPLSPKNHRVNPELTEMISKYAMSAREEIFKWLFDAKTKMSGEFAEQHKNNLVEFASGCSFLGKKFSLEDRGSFARTLARLGAPLIICEYGYCGKKFDDAENICRGEKCPPECPNHLILETAVPTIIRRWAHCIHELNLLDERDLWPKLSWDKDRYEGQLADLGVNTETLDRENIHQEVERISIEIRLRNKEKTHGSL